MSEDRMRTDDAAVLEREIEAPSTFESLLDRPALFALTEKDDARAVQLAQRIVKGGWAPKGMSFEACYCAIVFGAELGIPAMAAVQNIAVINGRPGVYGDMALALVLRSGKCVGTPIESYEGEGEQLRAVCVIRRRGAEEVVRSFSVAQARKAKLWGKQGPWTEYPARMLQMRARALALRDAFPDILKGVAIAEEHVGVDTAPAPTRRNGQTNVETIPEDDLLASSDLPDFADSPAEAEPEPEPQPQRKRPPRKHARDTAAELVDRSKPDPGFVADVLRESGCASGKLEDADDEQARALIRAIEDQYP